MPRESRNTILGTLLRFIAKLQDNRGDYPHLEAPIAKLLNLAALAQEAAAQQATHIAGKQEASKKFDGYVTDALRLLTVLRVSLKEHYGIRSEKLAEFGIQPFRGRNRKVKPVDPTVEPPAESPDSES